jgi:hypothetical protein
MAAFCQSAVRFFAVSHGQLGLIMTAGPHGRTGFGKRRATSGSVNPSICALTRAQGADGPQIYPRADLTSQA